MLLYLLLSFLEKNKKQALKLRQEAVKGLMTTFVMSKRKEALFCLIFVGLFIFLTPVFADSSFNDDFESYPLGNLVGNDNWFHTTSDNKTQVVNNPVYAGTRSASCFWSAGGFDNPYKMASTTEIGSLNLKFYLAQPTNVNAEIILAVRGTFESGGTTIYGLKFDYNATTSQYDAYVSNDYGTGFILLLTNVATGTWNDLTIQWEGTTDKMKTAINGTASNWTYTNYPFGSANRFQFSACTYGYIYIDDMVSIPYLTNPTDPIFDINYPTDCVYTTSTSPISFNASGTISVPSLSPYVWTDFSVIAQEFSTASTTYFSTSTTLLAGSNYSYDIPITLPDGAWKISYRLSGFYNGEVGVFYTTTHYCETTGIGTGLPLPVWKEITEAEFLGLEDCSGYPLLERLVCDLKNAIKRIFIPSDKNMSDLKATLEGLKQKAPMNYISATKDFFSNINNNVSNATLTFAVLGKTGNVDFSFWDRTSTIGGISQTFAGTIRIFFTFILVLAFMFWAISYVRKVFR